MKNIDVKIVALILILFGIAFSWQIVAVGITLLLIAYWHQ